MTRSPRAWLVTALLGAVLRSQSALAAPPTEVADADEVLRQLVQRVLAQPELAAAMPEEFALHLGLHRHGQCVSANAGLTRCVATSAEHSTFRSIEVAASRPITPGVQRMLTLRGHFHPSAKASVVEARDLFQAWPPYEFDAGRALHRRGVETIDPCTTTRAIDTAQGRLRYIVEFEAARAPDRGCASYLERIFIALQSREPSK